MSEQTMVIKTVLMPKYYMDFQCLAADCRDDCCHGWHIEFDKKDFLRLRRADAPEEFKKRLDNTVRRLRGARVKKGRYACFQMDKQGRCPMQDADGLCSLQKTCGHGALPEVCQKYPRIEQYTTAAKEICLSPSCEGVLALLWDLPEGVDFIEEELPAEERRTAHFHGFWPAFTEVRSLCVDVLQARQLPLPKRMILLGVVLQDLMNLDWDAPDLEGWCARTAARLDDPQTAALLEQMPGNRSMFLSQNLTVTIKMKDEAFSQELMAALNVGFTLNPETGKLVTRYDPERYEQARAALAEGLGDIEYFFENLMVASAIQLTFPSLGDKEALWKSYVNLCGLYSYFRFAAAAGCADAPTKEQLFHVLAMASRYLLHNRERRAIMQDEFFQHDSATLAHMAVLVGE